MVDGESKSIVKGDPTSLPPGYGPRHMTVTTRFPEGQQRVYVVNELQPFISIFKFDEETKRLEDQGVVEVMPPNTPGQNAAEIDLHPNENWLYCSNRGNGAILVYKILQNGNLDKIEV